MCINRGMVNYGSSIQCVKTSKIHCRIKIKRAVQNSFYNIVLKQMHAINKTIKYIHGYINVHTSLLNDTKHNYQLFLGQGALRTGR